MPHLEGLRGIAIVLILLFHLGRTGDSSPISLPGGYLGVEMFLVLSGFLLALGFARRQEGSLDFARKKLLRIMYPVSVMLILTVMVCLFCMDFADLLITGTNALWASLSANNIQLSMSGAEYFADDSTYNPLLHTWYIAITVQLYILFYVGYRLLKKCNRWARYAILFIIAVFSFFYGQCDEWRAQLISLLHLPLWVGDPGSMYYSTIARLWEPLAGAAILLMPLCGNRWVNLSLCILAVSGIAVNIWLLPPQAMLLTVICTMFLIRYGTENPLEFLFNNKVTRTMGKVSFSIYLVHMPIIVCHKCFTFMPLSWLSSGLLIAMSVVVGCLFWWLVEKRKISLWGLLIAWAAALGGSVLLVCSDGLKEYWNRESNNFVLPIYKDWKEEKDEASYVGFNKEKINLYNGWVTQAGISRRVAKRDRWLLRLGCKSKKASFVLVGDSHAGHYFTGLDVVCTEKKVTGLYLTSLVIPFWNREWPEGAIKNYYWNREKAEAIMDWLGKHSEISHVIIGQSWNRFISLERDWSGRLVPTSTRRTGNLEMLREFCLQLKSLGKHVIIIGPEPRFEEKTPTRYFRYLLRNGYSSSDKPYPKCVCSEAEYYERFREVLDYMSSMEKDKVCTVVYPHKYLFSNGWVRMESNGRIIFRDHHHLSVDGSEYIVRKMWDELSSTFQEMPDENEVK